MNMLYNKVTTLSSSPIINLHLLFTNIVKFEKSIESYRVVYFLFSGFAQGQLLLLVHLTDLDLECVICFIKSVFVYSI